MKRVLLFLSVFTFILFASCEKEEEPYSLVTDLQDGYWETDFTSGAIMVQKFNTSTVTSHWIEGTPPCSVDISTQNYSLAGNELTLESFGDAPVTVEIEGNILTMEVDEFIITLERKSTLDYPDC